MTSTARQRGAISLIIQNLGLDKETKELMVLNYSNGRGDSTKHLTYEEADHMIKSLNKVTGYKKEETPEDKMRNKILSLFHFMWYKTKQGKIDMPRVNGWCCQYGPSKKPLDDHDHDELVDLVTAVEQYYKKFLKGI